MIKANVDAAVTSLVNFEAEMKRKLEGMVERFAADVAEKAIDNTPEGDDVLFASLYQRRYRETGLEPQSGFAKGSWRYSDKDDQVLQEYYNGDWALGDLISDAKSYKLGQTFYITNAGPYIQLLEGGLASRVKAPNGIKGPTLAQIQAVYRADLPNYYKAS